MCFFGICALAALRALGPDRSWSAGTESANGFPGWSAAPIPTGLSPLALDAREVRFAREFPGQIAAFTDGYSTWIVRWLRHPTRRLHPACDCLRATGYTVKPEPIFVVNDGTHWGTLTAMRGPERLLVRERILDAKGREFTDVSAWFWAAALDQSAGPWWCLTRIEAGAAPR